MNAEEAKRAAEVAKKYRIEPVELTAEDVKDYLRRPQAFALWSHADHYEEFFKTRALGPTVVHRESDSATRSDFEVMGNYLRELPFEEGEDWAFMRCGHAAVGWCEHLSFRVLDENGEVAQVAKYVHGILEKQEKYTVLDADHWSNLEWEEKQEEVEEELRDALGRSPTDDEYKKIWATSAWDTQETGGDTYREVREMLAEAGILPEE